MKINFRTVILLLSVSMSLTSFAWGSSHTATGKVTSGKKPLAGVVVSDGFNCTATDAKGRYTLPINDRASNISVSTPAGYLPKTDSLNRPAFFIPVEDGRTDYSFDLVKNPRDDRRHAFMAQSDVQVLEEWELEKYDEQVADAHEHFKQFKECDVFGIDCGDVVFDTPALFQSGLRHRAGLGFPLYIANGNHDQRYGARAHEGSKERFEREVGPTNYSFNRGDIHYIAIDNVHYLGRDVYYIGYVDEQTFDWLEQDLSYVPEGSTVVMFMHIPLAYSATPEPFRYDSNTISKQTVNARHLIEMMKPYNTHFITGHMHTGHNVEFSDRAFEHNTPGTCGMWWDAEICTDGTPQGYGVYIVDGSDVKWYYKSKGYDKTHQLRGYRINADPKFPGEIIANVWNYDPKWRIEWLEDGVVIGEMTQYEGLDPAAVERTNDRAKLRHKWIGPRKTDHLFHAKPVNTEAKMSIRATDRFGNVYECPVE